MREKWFGGLILERRFSMTHFRLDVSQETGAATLWMATEETACGFKPVLAWPSMEGVRDFAHIMKRNKVLFH